MKLFCIFLFIPFSLFTHENKYLKKFVEYKKSSYYAAAVYNEHSWQTFYSLSDIHQTIQPDNIDLHLLNACLFYAANKLRAMYKIPPLKMDFHLKNAAAIHSYQMNINHFFSHTNPYVTAIKACSDRLKICGVSTSTGCAENCHKACMGLGTLTYIEFAQNVIESFFHSAGHKRNLMCSSYKFMACAAAYNFVEEEDLICIYVTQDFY